MPKKLYRIEWIDTETGKTGHGEPISKSLADSWAKHGNEEYPEIKHKVVEVK